MRDIYSGFCTMTLSILLLLLSWSAIYGGESQNAANFIENDSANVDLQSKNDPSSDVDTDGDGVTDSLEFKYGTDPNHGNSKPIGIYYEYDAFGRLLEIRRFTTP